MALLDVQDLVVEFPTRRGVLRAIDGVSLSIEAGEMRYFSPNAVSMRRQSR